MPRAEIEAYRLATGDLSARVKDALEVFFLSLDFSKPETARDALLEFLPVLVDQYGAVAATLAADWYEELRGASGALGSFSAVTAASVPAGAVEAKVRFLASHLWTPEPAAMLGGLLTAADKYVKQPGRDTVAYNAKREGVRWARVPTGAKTCSFCLVLASRDAVYLTEKAATHKANGDRYHGDCDCQPVRIGRKQDYPDNYLPDDYLAMYKAARGDAKSGDIKDIAASFRRLHPDIVNDGVHSH